MILLIPISTYPLKISRNPFINGKPGTKSSDVDIIASEVCSGERLNNSFADRRARILPQNAEHIKAKLSKNPLFSRENLTIIKSSPPTTLHPMT